MEGGRKGGAGNGSAPRVWKGGPKLERKGPMADTGSLALKV